MAKKSIVLSNGDGKVTFSVTSSAWIEDTDNSLKVSSLTASTLSIDSLPSGVKLLKTAANSISDITSSTIDNSALVWGGTSWTTSSTVYAEYSGSVGGDLSGSFPSVQVKNISNVSSGTLPASRGGTGVSIASNNTTILEVSGSTISGLTVNSSMAGWILQSVNNQYRFAPSINAPRVYFYTASAATVAGGQTSYTWTKPTGHTYVRVCLQGAGAGGTSGHTYDTGYHNGAGGGSGGYSEKIYDFSSIPDSITVLVGKGGAGGLGNAPSNQQVFMGAVGDGYMSTGGAGGSTNFNAGALIANGASSTNFPWLGGGSGGSGTIFNGSAGGANANSAGTAVGAAATNNSSGGGTGGGAAGGTVTLVGIGSTSRSFAHTLDYFSNSINAAFGQGATGAIWNGLSTTRPSTPTYGAGGGGGAAATATGQSAGGNGGDGFALIVSW